VTPASSRALKISAAVAEVCGPLLSASACARNPSAGALSKIFCHPAVKHTTVSHAALMVGTMPVSLGVAAVLFAGERLDPIGWIALVGSTVGAALIVLGGHRGPAAQGQPTLYGDLLVVLSLSIALTWVLLSKKLMQSHSPVVVTAYSILTGTGMLALWILGPMLLNPFRVSQPMQALMIWIAAMNGSVRNSVHSSEKPNCAPACE